MTDTATRPSEPAARSPRRDNPTQCLEGRLLAALQHGRWDDGSPVIDASDRALMTRVVPHLTAVVATEAAGWQPTKEVLRHA